jgi:hypothetical protein
MKTILFMLTVFGVMGAGLTACGPKDTQKAINEGEALHKDLETRQNGLYDNYHIVIDPGGNLKADEMKKLTDTWPWANYDDSQQKQVRDLLREFISKSEELMRIESRKDIVVRGDASQTDRRRRNAQLYLNSLEVHQVKVQTEARFKPESGKKAKPATR